MLNRFLWHLSNVYITGYHIRVGKLTIARGDPGLVSIDSSDRNGGNSGKQDGVSHELVAPHVFYAKLRCSER